MNNFLVNLFLKSTGLKRSIASLLAVLVAVAPGIPQLEPFVPLLIKLAALFGAVGVGHALLAPKV